jgi:hypothetical protein
MQAVAKIVGFPMQFQMPSHDMSRYVKMRWRSRCPKSDCHVQDQNDDGRVRTKSLPSNGFHLHDDVTALSNPQIISISEVSPITSDTELFDDHLLIKGMLQTALVHLNP